MTKKMTYYQKLRTIRMPVIEARKRLLWQLDWKFERAMNERARMLSSQGIDCWDIFHIDRMTDEELQRLTRGYLHYHRLYESMRINESSLRHEVYKFTGEFHTDLSVAEIEEAHLAELRKTAKKRSA